MAAYGLGLLLLGKCFSHAREAERERSGTNRTDRPFAIGQAFLVMPAWHDFVYAKRNETTRLLLTMFDGVVVALEDVPSRQAEASIHADGAFNSLPGKSYIEGRTPSVNVGSVSIRSI
jgi:hypothetical protein